MDWKGIRLEDFTESAFTPVTPEEFVGIRINAPEMAGSGAAPFAVSGTLTLPAERVYRIDNVRYAVVLVAVDLTRHRAFAHNLIHPGRSVDRVRPSPRKDPDWMENHYISRFFAVNLPEYVQNLPREKAEYLVYAVLEEHMSNVVRVRYDP